MQYCIVGFGCKTGAKYGVERALLIVPDGGLGGDQKEIEAMREKLREAFLAIWQCQALTVLPFADKEKVAGEQLTPTDGEHP